MLTPERNARLTQVGPGTPMGNLMRRYWLPALLSEELPEPDGAPGSDPAILQLVASGRGIAALPSWTVDNYIERGYVVSRPIGPAGLRCELYAATTHGGAEAAYIREFIALTRAQSLTELAGVSAL